MASASQEEKARGYLEEANQLMKRRFPFFGGQRMEDAAEALKKAGNCFKTAKKFHEAGDAFKQAAEIHQKHTREKYEAATSYVEAANCIKNVDPLEATALFRSALDYYIENGRFSQAGKIHKEVAEIYEAESRWEDAIAAYQEAVDSFNNDDRTQAAQQYLNKIAMIYSGELGEYGKAASIFEEMGRYCVDQKLLQMQAKSYFMQAILCLLAIGDPVASKQKLEAFKTVDYSFPTSKECGFVEDLMVAMEDYNADEFSRVCFDYDKIYKLDPWKTSILVRIKRNLKTEAGEDEEVDLT